jgi:predicted DNA-binding transcriptional regulator YafY
MAVKDRPLFRRILEFDDLLRRRRPVNATSLAARWKTSTKTVQRFVAFMRDEMDAPIVFDRKRGSFRYSDPAWHLPWIPVEGPGLFAIGVAAKVLQLYEGTPVAEGLREAFQRISDVMPPEIRVSPGAFVERLYIHPQPIRLVDPAVWNAVATAIRERTVLKIRYQKPAGETSVRRLAPYGLVLAAGDWLVAAQDRDDDPGTVKTFYVARIRSAEASPELFSIPRDFDLKHHFGETIGIFVGSEPFRFRVRFAKAMAAWVAEVRWHPKQKLTSLPNGELELELPAGSLFEARRFVLSFGREAVALAPPELVEALRTETGEMAAAYRAGTA